MPTRERHGLGRNGPFVALTAARAVSLAGDMVAAVALVLLVSRNHSATAVGGLLLAESLPQLLSAHAGALVDRVANRRRLMIGAQLGQGCILAVITLWLPPYAALLALLVLVSLLGTIVRAAAQTVMPMLVPDEDLLAANAIAGTAQHVSFILGPALGGALAGLAGPRAALALDTATFIVSALTLLRLPHLPRARSTDETDTGGVRAAFRYLMGDPVLRSLFLSLGMLVAFAGVDNVALVFLVRDTLGGGSAAYGAAMAVFGLGLVLGATLIVRHRHWRPERMLFGSILSTTAGSAGLGIAPSLAFVYPAQILGGVGNGIDVAAQSTLVQRRTPPAMLGRVSGASQVAVAVGFLFAYLGGGALVDATSPRTAFIVAGVGTLLALAVAAPVWRAPATTST